MKTHSGERPQPKLDLGNGKWQVYMDIHEVDKQLPTGTEDQSTTVRVWESEYVEVDGRPTYPKVVEELIRERYTVSDELGILRQKELNYDEFVVYNQYAEHCKAIARPVFFHDEEEGVE